MTGVALQEQGAHHGSGGQGNEERNADSNAKDDGEFTEQAADDAAHQQDGNEDGDQRGAHGQNGEADFAGALYGGFPGAHSRFDVVRNVFDDHDGVIHYEAGTDGQGHEGEIVQRVVAEIHDPEGADEGKRNGYAGNNGGPIAT